MDFVVLRLQKIYDYLNVKIPQGDALDSENHLSAFLGKSNVGRLVYVEQGGGLAVIQGDWKYISPSKNVPYLKYVQIESGSASAAQLYNLKDDIGEQNNVASRYPEKVKALEALLQHIKENSK